MVLNLTLFNVFHSSIDKGLIQIIIEKVLMNSEADERSLEVSVCR